jgi:hypothetical protein
MKRLHREDVMVRPGPENGGHEEPVLPAGDVRLRGCVVYVVYPLDGSAGSGG